MIYAIIIIHQILVAREFWDKSLDFRDNLRILIKLSQKMHVLSQNLILMIFYDIIYTLRKMPGRR